MNIPKIPEFRFLLYFILAVVIADVLFRHFPIDDIIFKVFFCIFIFLILLRFFKTAICLPLGFFFGHVFYGYFLMFSGMRFELKVSLAIRVAFVIVLWMLFLRIFRRWKGNKHADWSMYRFLTKTLPERVNEYRSIKFYKELLSEQKEVFKDTVNNLRQKYKKIIVFLLLLIPFYFLADLLLKDYDEQMEKLNALRSKNLYEYMVENEKVEKKYLSIGHFQITLAGKTFVTTRLCTLFVCNKDLDVLDSLVLKKGALVKTQSGKVRYKMPYLVVKAGENFRKFGLLHAGALKDMPREEYRDYNLNRFKVWSAGFLSNYITLKKVYMAIGEGALGWLLSILFTGRYSSIYTLAGLIFTITIVSINSAISSWPFPSEGDMLASVAEVFIAIFIGLPIFPVCITIFKKIRKRFKIQGKREPDMKNSRK